MAGWINKLAIRLCDNCSIHRPDDLLRDFSEKGIVVITYPPHTSHIFQVLDVLFFGRLKSAKKYVPQSDSDPAGINHIA
jgi:hypothetical protein